MSTGHITIDKYDSIEMQLMWLFGLNSVIGNFEVYVGKV